MDIIHGKLKPVLEKIRSSRIAAQTGTESQFVTKNGMSFLEMKYNLMLSYCSLISFYILLKLEGKDVSGHPVVERLLHLKLLLEKLRPLDLKMQYQVDKMVRTAVLEQTDGRPLAGQAKDLSYKPNVTMMEGDDDNEEEASNEEEEDSDDADQEQQDDDDDSEQGPQ